MKRINRLYEQGADYSSIGDYGRRWNNPVEGGLGLMGAAGWIQRNKKGVRTKSCPQPDIPLQETFFLFMTTIFNDLLVRSIEHI